MKFSRLPPNMPVAAGLSGRPLGRRALETAYCACGGALRFETDSLGRLVEICENRQCPQHRPHAPAGDASDWRAPRGYHPTRSKGGG